MKTTRHGVSSVAITLLIFFAIGLVLKAQTDLEPVDPTNIPTDGGAFFLMSDYLSNSGTLGGPYPFLKDTNDAVYSLSGGCYIVDDVSLTNDDDLINALSLLAEPQDSFSARLMGGAMTMDDADPNPGDAGSGDTNSGGYSPLFSSYSFDTNSLWLQITNVADSLAYLNLYNATDQVYAIWSTTNLLSSWSVQTEVWPTNSTVMPFTVPALPPENLFLLAEDWTGVTEDGNTIPDWWFWKYYHETSLYDTNLDSVGNTLLSDYSNDVDPNIIQFSMQFTNTYFNTVTAHGSLAVSGGTPFYEATLIDDTNTADAVWQPYPGTNVSVSLPSSNGTYAVQVGLRGLPNNAVQSWLPVRLTLRTNPPTLTITNPASATVSIPMIQLQGAADESLRRLAFGVSNAMGVLSNQTGYVTDEFYDTNLLSFTTNYFQCYDVKLTNGLNTVTLQATDRAGNTATITTNFTLDYSGVTGPPTLTVTWPPNNAQITAGELPVGDIQSGSHTFQLLAQVSDPTATVAVTVSDALGDTRTVPALVERNGTVVAQNLPLLAATNSITLAVSNAAGYGSQTTFTVYANTNVVTLIPLSSDQLNQSSVSVYGGISDPRAALTVNGVQATNNGDGTWFADGVPVSPTGTATFDLETTNSDGTSGNQIIAEAQPVTVTVMSYSSAYRSSWTGVNMGTGYENDDYDWSYIWGGNEYWNYVLWNQGGDDADISTNYPISSGVDALSDYFGDRFVAQSGFMGGTFNNVSPYFDILLGVYGPEAYDAQTELMIDPSGYQPPGETALYLVEISAMSYTNMDDARSHYSGEVPVPPTEIYINGEQCLNSGVTNADGSVSGMTIVSAASGASPSLDITVPGKGLVSFTTNLCLPVTLQIVDANAGEVLTDQTNYTVIVGQQMNLHCQLSLTNQNIVTNFPVSNFQWTIPGYAISNYVIGANTNTSMVVTNFPLNNSNVVFYWLDGASNRVIQCSATVGGNPATVESALDIIRPTVDFIGSIGDKVAVDTNYAFGRGFVALHFGASVSGGTTNYGISCVSTNPNTFGYPDGLYAFYLVQVVSQEHKAFTNSDSSSTATNIAYALDNFYPTENMGSGDGTLFTDAPGIGEFTTNVVAASLVQNFQTVLLFEPEAPSVPVPLKEIDWGWSGSIVLSNGVWTLTSSNAAISVNDQNTTNLPYWTNVVFSTRF